jgi:hypothetical protein
MIALLSRRRRTRQRTIVYLLVAVLVAHGAAAPRQALAILCPPGQSVLDYHGQEYCTVDSQYGQDVPAGLLNSDNLRLLGTQDQRDALNRLALVAVTNTMKNHGIAPNEFATTQTWGRADAQAELWALIQQAMFTVPPPCSDDAIKAGFCRTADQQLVDDFFNDVFKAELITEHNQAALEYATWAGLDLTSVEQALENDPTRTSVADALRGAPVTEAQYPGGGFCNYVPPDDTGIDYTGRSDQQCIVGCVSVLGCDPPYPAFDAFEAWGTARVLNGGQTAPSPGFASAFRAVILGIAGGGMAAAAAAGVGLGNGLASTMVGTAFTTALFPNAARAATAIIGPTGEVLTEGTSEAAAAASAGALGAAAVGAIANAVIVFVTVTAARIYQLVTIGELPDKIADWVMVARETQVDVGSMIADLDFLSDSTGDPSGREAADQLLALAFSRFVEATTPAAVPNTSCPNELGLSHNPPVADCYNNPPIPVASASDPLFFTDGHPSPTISVAEVSSDGVQYANTVRLHGPWFIQTGAGQTVQNLRLQFTDVVQGASEGRTAWLLQRPSGRWVFVGTGQSDACGDVLCPFAPPDPTCGDLDVCVSANDAGWQSYLIEFIGGDGQVHTAYVLPQAQIDWPTPDPISYGTPLTATQLDATAKVVSESGSGFDNIDGTFAYTVDGSPVTAAENRVIPGGTHTLSVTFTPTGNSAAMASPATKSVSLVVNPVSLSVSPAIPTGYHYGDTGPTIGVTYSGFVNGDDASDLTTAPTCTTTATSASPVATYPVHCSGGVSPSYTFQYLDDGATIVVNKRNLDVSGPTFSSTYGNTISAIQPVYDLTDFVNGDGPNTALTAPSCSVAATSASPVGNYFTTCTGGSFANYSVTPHTGILTIGVRPLSITGATIGKTYGQTVTFTGTEFSVPPGALVNGDQVQSVTLSSTGAPATAPANPAGYPINVSNAVGTGLTNYLIAFNPGHLSVDQATLTITANSRGKTYGQTVTFAGTEFKTDGLVNSDSVSQVTLTSAGAAASASVLGSAYDITPSSATGTGLSNYKINYQKGSLTVSPAPLTITASSAVVPLGGTVPAITPSYSGFVAGDGPSALMPGPTCSTTAASGSPAGTYPSSCSGAADSNYQIGYTGGTVKITYAVNIRFDVTLPSKSGSTIPIKVEIHDATGRNVSSASTAVTLANPAITPSPAPGAQPTGPFVFVPNGPFYQYDLKTAKYPNGTWTMTFLVAGDPVPHTLQFALR